MKLPFKVIQCHSFYNQSEANKGSISSYNMAGLISEVSEEVATQIDKHYSGRQPHSHLGLALSHEELPRISAYTLYLQKLVIGLHFCRCMYGSIFIQICASRLQKTQLFCNSVRLGRSRLSKVEHDFDTNRKRVCDSLFVPIVTMVISSTVSEIRRRIG